MPDECFELLLANLGLRSQDGSRLAVVVLMGGASLRHWLVHIPETKPLTFEPSPKFDPPDGLLQSGSILAHPRTVPVLLQVCLL